jgi:serine/threonine-protein kinase
MSPEQLQAQATGQEIDSRSDIFSFGIVLYEVITGKRAFEGKSPASVIAAIMEHPAPSIADIAPPALDRVLKKCLAKDPDERWQTARDLKDELQWIAGASVEAATAPSAVPPKRPRVWMIAAGVAMVIAVAASGIAYRATRPAELKPLVRLDVDLGPERTVRSIGGPDVVLSPDGTRLAYLSQDRLFTRRLDQSQGTELAGTVGAASPFFSPDGQWIAFTAGGKLKKISVAGGAAVALADAILDLPVGGSWGEDGTIVAALNFAQGLQRIPVEGGAAAPLTELDRERRERTHRWPQILPGGKTVVFTSHTSVIGGYDGAAIEAVSLVDGSRKTLVKGATFGRYLRASSGSGYLLYVDRGTLFAVPFDPATLEVRGSAVPVLEQVAYSPGNGSAKLDVSQSGTLLYENGAYSSSLVTVQWLEEGGKTRPLLAKPGNYARPSISPDGRRVALEINDGSNRDIWVQDLERDTVTRLTFDGKGHVAPIWTPDGRSVVFHDSEGLSWARFDGGGQPQLLLRTKGTPFPWSFAPDGKRLAYMETTNGYDLWTLPIEGDSTALRAGKPEVLLQTAFDERFPTVSPDGRWMAYTSNESGTYELYVRAFAEATSGGGKWQISSGGGAYPMWSRTGRQLFFENLDNRVMVAAYSVQGSSFVAEKPRLWSDRQLANLVYSSKNLDLAPDGKRFAVILPVEETGSSQVRSRVTYIENFSDEVRRKASVGK